MAHDDIVLVGRSHLRRVELTADGQEYPQRDRLCGGIRWEYPSRGERQATRLCCGTIVGRNVFWQPSRLSAGKGHWCSIGHIGRFVGGMKPQKWTTCTPLFKVEVEKLASTSTPTCCCTWRAHAPPKSSARIHLPAPRTPPPARIPHFPTQQPHTPKRPSLPTSCYLKEPHT